MSLVAGTSGQAAAVWLSITGTNGQVNILASSDALLSPRHARAPGLTGGSRCST